jgi:hypothetical protein
VKFGYYFSDPDTGTVYDGWYGGTSQADATKVKITSPGQTDIAIVL